MIKFMLDTNICIYLMQAQPPQVVEKFKSCRHGEIVMSAVTWAELSCGLNTHNSLKQLAALQKMVTVVPFDVVAAAKFGELSQHYPNRKSSFDRMIAAHALALGVTLVTNNLADFVLYELPLENWVEE